MTEALGTLLVLAVALYFVVRGSSHRWNGRLARVRARSVDGPNLGTLLLTVGIAALLYKAAQLPIVGQIPLLSYALVAIAVVLVIGVVVSGSFVRVVVALLGVLLLVMTIGAHGAVVLVVLTSMLLWLLGVARGFLG